MSTRRRTLVRTAAVTAVSGALLMPAAAAFADSPTPAPSASATTPAKDNKDNKDQPKDKKDQRKLVKTVKLADKVSTAKVFQAGPSHFEAEIYANGAKLDTLVANGKAAYGQNNGLHIALQPDGQIKSWVEGAKGKDEKKPQDKSQVTPGKTPRGGVKAGAEGVSSGDNPALLAAGGGMAAAG
ncbi:hypothetical protein P8605_24365, partial [Streptomyces sp. T-3]|nr:hypothetical protein [Streptomyces sp. T-3]